MVIFREKRNQLILRLGVYISGRAIVSHRNRDGSLYIEIGFEIRLSSWVFWGKMSGMDSLKLGPQIDWCLQ